MNVKTMDKINAHFDAYFRQSALGVLHPVVDNGHHIDVLLYEPTEKLPFWKLVTMGASDYKMPKIPNTFGLFNEYIMFVDKDEDLNDREIVSWYCSKLVMIASYAKYNNTHITYGHSFEWENEDPDDEMIAAYIELPQVITDAEILRCKIGMLKTVICLQAVLLNQNELNKLMEIGPEAFSYYLYPENGGKSHYISERHRSERF